MIWKSVYIQIFSKNRYLSKVFILFFQLLSSFNVDFLSKVPIFHWAFCWTYIFVSITLLEAFNFLQIMRLFWHLSFFCLQYLISNLNWGFLLVWQDAFTQISEWVFGQIMRFELKGRLFTFLTLLCRMRRFLDKLSNKKCCQMWWLLYHFVCIQRSSQSIKIIWLIHNLTRRLLSFLVKSLQR